MSPSHTSAEPTPSELIFLGTGTSGAVPVISCLTSPKRKTSPCPTCCSGNPKNSRMNTGCALRIPKPHAANPSSPTAHPDDSFYSLLIDCGKTFFPTATTLFPQHSLRRIDALLLTHAHADAFFGLDDLRAWTLPSTATDEPAIQEHIDVYCDARTMSEVERTFPYLVDKNAATGGGDVPSFVWHVFDPERGGYADYGTQAEKVEQAGQAAVPENGVTVDQSSIIAAKNDASSTPGQNGTSHTTTNIPDASFRIDSCGGLKVTPLPVEHGRYMKTGAPFMCMGFRIGDFSWVSDCSGVPDGTRARMRGSRVVVMDGLKWEGHASHFGIPQGREWVRDNLGVGKGWRRRGGSVNGNENGSANGNGVVGEREEGEDGPERTWLVGFSHNVEHEHATRECQEWGIGDEGRGMWVRPAWDGLRIGVDGAPIESD